MSSYVNKGIFYTSLVLIPLFVWGIKESYTDAEIIFFSFLTLLFLVAAWKTAPEDLYLSILVKNISKKFKSHKEKLKENLEE
jgi:hypothetical protein